MTRRLAFGFAMTVALASCQLVSVPSGACFQGEACARSGGGRGGGGGSTGGGGGGGDDAGVADAGGEVPNLFKDAGICENWACVASKLPAPGTVLPTFVEHDLAVAEPPPPASCGAWWLGGVLLPDGRVLAIPACADHFLLIDPVALTADLVGPALNSIGAPLFLSGVLGCDGRAYAIPAFQSQVARVTVTPGSTQVEVAFFDTGTEPAIHGAVVAQSCDQGLVIAGIGIDVRSDLDARAHRIHVRENGVELSSVDLMPAEQLVGGAFRLGDDSVWLGASTSVGGLSRHILTRFDPDDGGVVLLPLADPQHGYNLYPTGYAVDGLGGAVFIQSTGESYRLSLDAGAPAGVSLTTLSVTPPPSLRNLAWPAARGDGFIYTAGASLMAISARDGGSTLLMRDITDGGADTLEGLVVTFDGSLVGVPGADSVVRVFKLQNGGGLPAPREVLLSPFFDKL